jgi:hypothetical protein
MASTIAVWIGLYSSLAKARAADEAGTCATGGTRHHILNLQWVEKADLTATSGLAVTLRGGQVVEMPRRQSEKLREIPTL